MNEDPGAREDSYEADRAYAEYMEAEYAKFHEEALQAEYQRAYETWAQDQRDSQGPDSEEDYIAYLENFFPEGA